MKKLLVCGLLAASAAEANVHQGFYVGLTAGYRNLVNKIAVTEHGTKTSAGKADASLGTLNAGLALTYLHGITDSTIVGLELAGAFNPGTSKAEFVGAGLTNLYTLKIKSAYDYSLAAILGMSIDKALPYIKVGLAGTSLQVKAKRSDPNNLVGAGTSDFNFKKSKRPLGLLVGLGVQFPISDSFYVGTEYAYAHFMKKISLSDGVTGGRDFKITSRAHTFKVKLAYKF